MVRFLRWVAIAETAVIVVGVSVIIGLVVGRNGDRPAQFTRTVVSHEPAPAQEPAKTKPREILWAQPAQHMLLDSPAHRQARALEEMARTQRRMESRSLYGR